jgi:UDP-glucuronate 4-epimerase
LASVLVTGAAGFIGSHLVERLVADGHQVVGLDAFDDAYDPAIKRRNLEGALRHKAFRLVEGDVRDRDALSKAADAVDIVVHLAARAGVRASLRDPLLYEDVNVRGTMNVLAVCSEKNVSRLIFGSSSSVYGMSAQPPFSEDDPAARPISPYAATKRAAELMCFTHHHLHGLPITCLRFFTVYGPRQRPDMAIHQFTRRIDRGERITLFGDGTSARDYTYVDDIIDGVMASLSLASGFDIINLGGAETTQLRELVSLVEKALGKRAQIEWLPDQPGDVAVTFADVSKARRLLGYAPKVKVPEGVARFVEWYRAQAR